MRIDALEDQETGFQCGDADDNDEGRYILFYFSLAKFAWPLMREILILHLEVFIMFKNFKEDDYVKALNITLKVWCISAFMSVMGVMFGMMLESLWLAIGGVIPFTIVTVFDMILAEKAFEYCEKKED